jgi:hypothetical protein
MLDQPPPIPENIMKNNGLAVSEAFSPRVKWRVANTPKLLVELPASAFNGFFETRGAFGSGPVKPMEGPIFEMGTGVRGGDFLKQCTAFKRQFYWETLRT